MDAGTPLPLLNAEVNDLRFAGACAGAQTNLRVLEQMVPECSEQAHAVRREPKLHSSSDKNGTPWRNT